MTSYNSIILSGLAGSGKSTLARELTKRYKWPLVSIGDTWRELWAEQYPDKSISFEMYIESLSREEDRAMNERMRSTYEQGKVIGDARYAVCYKNISTALLIYVTASLDVRVRRGIGDPKYIDKSEEEVRRILIDREQHEVSVCKDLFGQDYRDASHYHVSVNSGLLTLEQEVDAIAALVPIPLNSETAVLA